jgi:hypothetical protein
MAPEPTKATPEDLGKLGTQLAGAGKAVEDSLGMVSDPAMWTAADLYKEYFGPATEVADIYATMAKKLPDYVHSASSRLNHGAEVFQQAATGFDQRDQQHGRQMHQAAPR